MVGSCASLLTGFPDRIYMTSDLGIVNNVTKFTTFAIGHEKPRKLHGEPTVTSSFLPIHHHRLTIYNATFFLPINIFVIYLFYVILIKYCNQTLPANMDKPNVLVIMKIILNY